MTTLAARYIEIAHALRMGHEASGYAKLAGALGDLEPLFKQGVLDPHSAAPILEVMLDAQSRGDVLLVADVLEHILAPSLEGLSPPEIP